MVGVAGNYLIWINAGFEHTPDDAFNAARAEILKWRVVAGDAGFINILLTRVSGGKDRDKVLELGQREKEGKYRTGGEEGGDVDGELERERENREDTGRDE